MGSLTLTSDDPDRVFRIQARDDEQRLAADLVVRPATPVVWDVGGSAFYGTTLDSTLEGTITIDGETTSVSTLCAFEHMRAAESEGKPTEGGWPAFWHYEYVQWADGGAGAPNGSILWHRTDEHDVLDATAGLHVSDGEGGAIVYDSYELDYKDVEDHDGRPLPGSWEVRATRGDETFTYRANVRQIVTSPPSGAPGLSELLLDCEGVHQGPAGATTLRGRGRAEFLVVSYNPCALDA